MAILKEFDMPKVYFVNMNLGETHDQAIMNNPWFLTEKAANESKSTTRIKVLMIRVEAVA